MPQSEWNENAAAPEDSLASLTAELGKILKSTHFSQSKRAQKFIRYVVEEVVAGRGDELKERSIGAVVFHKALDYDTGNDSSVRVVANDVRKRIAQFYQDEGFESGFVLELRPGTYRPHLRTISGTLEHAEIFARSEESAAGKLHLPLSVEVQRSTQESLAPADTPFRLPSAAFRRAAMVLAFCLGLVLIGGSVLAKRAIATEAHTFNPFWGDLDTVNPLLFCIGSHHVSVPTNTPDSPETVSHMNSISASVPLSDAIAVASLSNYLGRKGLPYMIIAANTASLAGIRRHPTIMFGGLDNVWTMKLLENLPFRFDTTRGSDGLVQRGSIMESDHARRTWSLDFSMNKDQWKKDYALVAQFSSAETGRPVIVVAGIGKAGTLAAMEFVTNTAYLPVLQNAGVGAEKRNFEAVLSTNVINGESGPPTLEAISLW